MLRHARSRGVSLLEIVIVLAIVGVAAGAVMRIATQQQRRYGTQAARTVVHGQLREGADILASELAGIAPAAGDIHEGGLGRTSVDFRAHLATALLCGAPASGANEIDLLHLGVLADSAHSGDEAAPEGWIAAGDSIVLYDASADTSGAAGGEIWRRYEVRATAAIRRACAPMSAATNLPVVRATIAPPVTGALEVHAPARVFRRVRYALYRAADGRWYLGFSDCRPIVRSPACAPMQPVAGPYLPDAGAAAAARSGLSFEYLDAAGRPIDDRLGVRAIRLTLRADASPGTAVAATLVATRTIGLRNTPR